jgi:hypothetical protein
MIENKDIKNEIEHLENIGRLLGYEIHKDYNIETNLNTFKFDLAFFKNNEIKAVIKVDNNFSNKFRENLKKLESLGYKCLFFSKHLAKTISPELLNFLVNSKNQIEIVTKKNKYSVYNDFLYKVVKFIENNPDTYVREIARSLNIHMEIVRRCLKTLSEFIETREFADPQLNLPQLPILIRLKEGYTAEKVIKAINIIKKIESLDKKEKRKTRMYLKAIDKIYK